MIWLVALLLAFGAPARMRAEGVESAAKSDMTEEKVERVEKTNVLAAFRDTREWLQETALLAARWDWPLGVSSPPTWRINLPCMPFVVNFSLAATNFTACALNASLPPVICTECFEQYMEMKYQYDAAQHAVLIQYFLVSLFLPRVSR